MPQEFKRKQTQRSSDQDPAQPQAEAPVQDKTLSDDVEAILDDIDDVLEVNAQEFVKNYVQKGGE